MTAKTGNNALHPAAMKRSGIAAGNVVLTGFDPKASYAVSLAAIDSSDRLGYFSPEIITGAGQMAASP